MKNQYFGDINDYMKYSLIRHLNGRGTLSTVVCWVLTNDDSTTDGSRTSYLLSPGTWGKYDPYLFRCLKNIIQKSKVREVSYIEQTKLLPNSRFFSEIIGDDFNERSTFFERFFEFSSGSDFIFFDPDNGFEIKSVRKGGKNSSKYIFLDEVQKAYELGSSVLVYQHYPRRKRDTFVSSLIFVVTQRTEAQVIFSYSASNVLFLLIPQPFHIERFQDYNKNIGNKWGEIIRINEHWV